MKTHSLSFRMSVGVALLLILTAVLVYSIVLFRVEPKIENESSKLIQTTAISIVDNLKATSKNKPHAPHSLKFPSLKKS